MKFHFNYWYMDIQKCAKTILDQHIRNSSGILVQICVSERLSLVFFHVMVLLKTFCMFMDFRNQKIEYCYKFWVKQYAQNFDNLINQIIIAVVSLQNFHKGSFHCTQRHYQSLLNGSPVKCCNNCSDNNTPSLIGCQFVFI